jgi:hypothetical protein
MNIARMQRSADRMIRSAGKGSSAALIRGTARRQVYACRMEWKPTERGLFEDNAERFFISALGLTRPPDFEQDILEFKGVGQKARQYRITVPAGGPRPNGMVIYYDLACMFKVELP